MSASPRGALEATLYKPNAMTFDREGTTLSAHRGAPLVVELSCSR